MHARTSLGGLVFGNLPSKGRDENLISGWGTKIPHALGKLRWHATREKPKHRNKNPTCGN